MQHPSLDLLMRRPFPELAVALRACAERILTRWTAIVREMLPTADELTFTQLRDDLPTVLEQVSKALESESPRPTEDLIEMSSAHGAVRFHQSFNLNELLVEYSLLRPIIIEEIADQLDRRIEAVDAVVLNAGIDVSMRRGVLNFVEHQRRQLQAATEAQSKYLSFLSHDLRGGLNGVFLMIEVLKRELVKEPRFAESLEDLDVMRRSLFETIGTMDRFLHAERFRKGKVQVKPAPLNLTSIVSDLCGQFSYQAKDKGVEMHIEATPRCELTSDRELLILILQNLISNAIKYSNEGTVRVSIAPEDGSWRIGVIDQGPGIEKQKLDQLFAPFQRGETYGQPGVGLGLSIARQAAEVIGGRLWAESEMGKGSTFFLKLPQQPPAPAPATDEAGQKQDRDGRKSARRI